ncbi:MAG: DNA-binding protein [Bacilli bacterium]
MDRKLYLINLYDYYGDLFTAKQQEYFSDYYLNDLSLSEIAENNGVSRNAIHGQLKNTTDKLEEYELILKLYEKGLKLRELINTINDKELQKKLEILI